MQSASLHYFSCNNISMKNVGMQVAYGHHPNYMYSCLPIIIIPTYFSILIVFFFYICLVSFFLCGHFQQLHYAVAEGCGQGLTALTCKHVTLQLPPVSKVVEGHD